MTLREVTAHLHSLTFGGHINGEKFTRQELASNIRRWLANSENNTIPNACVIEVCLADGRWLATVDKIADGYDYYIPETREQESRLYERLGITRCE